MVEAKFPSDWFYTKRPALKDLDRLQFIPFEKQIPYLSALHLVLESDLRQFRFDVYFRDVGIFREVIKKICVIYQYANLRKILQMQIL